MGAGAYGAGVGPAGHDPVAAATAPRDVSYPVGIKYDASSKSFPLDSDGLVEAEHPVDQMMAIGLCFRKGSIQGAAEVGNTFEEITNLGAANLALDIQDRIEKSVPIAGLLAAGDVVILSIDHEVIRHGGLKVAVQYYNLAADPRRRNPLTLTTG